MRRIHVIVDGYVQKVGYREHVRKEAVKGGITGYVKNLDTEEVEIVAEGREEDIHTFIKEINILRYPIQVTSCHVEWGDATGEWKRFNIIRGDIQEETFERMDYAGMIMHEILDVSKATLDHTKTSLQLQSQMLEKQDLMLGKQDQMLEKQDQMLEKSDLMLGKQDQMLEKQDQMLEKSDQMLEKSDQMLEKSDQMLGKQDQMLGKQDQMLEKSDQMLEKQDLMHQTGKETKEEIVRLRKETGKCLDDEFKEIKQKLHSIEDALSRAGIQV
ncbi:acylphosphatase [Methanocalculus taiwanensis]|uniref:acylphosphatase n=1 Tax=Methanocalculus taiwanensis TaxID=106207 RepID=A0ABD4TJ52_9EURY|nr:acylphosphatase [Methanocalculus taiwanensis]MCQ1538962.1 acylphosphatase [Methanocalculus taiwanensis]